MSGAAALQCVRSFAVNERKVVRVAGPGGNDEGPSDAAWRRALAWFAFTLSHKAMRFGCSVLSPESPSRIVREGTILAVQDRLAELPRRGVLGRRRRASSAAVLMAAIVAALAAYGGVDAVLMIIEGG